MQTVSFSIFEETDTLTETEVDVEVGLKKNLILYNDDYNTFEFVIETLIDLCGHSLEQAEQCTYLVHYSGKCAVKRGAIADLEPICKTMLNRGLTAEIH